MSQKTVLDKNGLSYLWSKIKALIPTNVSTLTNDSNYQTQTDVNNAITNSIDTTLSVFGKAADAAKVGQALADIAENAELNVNADWNATSGDAMILNKPTIPTKVSELTNDSNFIDESDMDEITAAEVETLLEDAEARPSDILSDIFSNYVTTTTFDQSMDEIDTMRNTLNQTRKALASPIFTVDDFEIGYIDIKNAGWTYSDRRAYIRTKEGTTLRLFEGDAVDITAGESVVFDIGWLNRNGSYNHQSGWKTHFDCPVTADYVLMARYDPEATVRNISDVFDKIVITRAATLNAKELENQVVLNRLNIRIINDKVGVYNLDKNNFDIGNIAMSSSGWTYSDRTTRVRTKEGYTIRLNAGDVIGMYDYSDARMYIGYQKTSDGTYGFAGWITTDFTCPYDGEYVILLCHLSDVTVNNVPELFDLLKITKASSNLPETVEELDAEVKALNDKVNEMAGGKIAGKFDSVDIPDLVWANGTSGSRLLSNEIDVSQYKAIRYSLPSGFQVGVRCKTADGIQFRDSGWDSTGIGFRLLEGATSAVIVMRKSTDASISPSEVDSSFLFQLFGNKMYDYNGHVQTIGHRGCDNCAPENTLASFAKAAKERITWVETDVRFTSDGVAVLMHDATINRTGRNADGTEIAETLNIADITYEQALTYDFGIFKGQSFAGQKIPTFAEFMRFCFLYGLKAAVELKGGITEERCRELCRIAVRNKMEENVLWLSSQWQERLAALTEIDPDLSFAWLANLDQSHLTEALTLKTSTNHIYIDAGEAYATVANQTLIDTANDAGVGILIWTVSAENKFMERIKDVNGIWGITTEGGDAAVGLILATW